MKLAISIASLLFCVLSISAQEKMNIRFIDSSTVSYDVDKIEKITFSTSTPDIPPTPSGKHARVIQAGNFHYFYDAEGRCNQIIDYNDNLELKINYADKTFVFNGTQVATFDIDSQGRITELAETGGDGFVKSDYEYDTEGHLIKLTEVYSFPDEKYNGTMTFFWENGNMTHAIETLEEVGQETFTSKLEVSYSEYENRHSQWTFGMLEDNELGISIIGMFGTPPRDFPSTTCWDTDSPVHISYIFNHDGTVNTETVGSKTFEYRYETEREQSVGENTRFIVPRIFKSHRRHISNH